MANIMLLDGNESRVRVELKSNEKIREISAEEADGLPPYKLHSAIDYIHECLEGDLSLAEIAKVVQMSPYHFARMFKKSTGLAPHQYVVQCRLEGAKALLADKTEIAFRVGFQSQSHFTTVFRKMTGATPKAYRNSI